MNCESHLPLCECLKKKLDLLASMLEKVSGEAKSFGHQWKGEDVAYELRRLACGVS